MITKTFVSKGDNVVIPVPTFHRYEFHTKAMGGEPVFVEMPDFRFDSEKVLSGEFKIVFLCNPNNPTGVDIPMKEKLKVLDNFKGIVVIDEALADIAKVNGSKLIDKYENLIITRSFSKSFGLASLRIGYIVANKSVIDQIRKMSSPFKVNGVAQELAIESLKDREHISNSIAFLNEERRYLINELRKLGLECTESKTTNILVDVSKIDKDAAKVVDKLKGEGILVTEASFFRVPENKYIRIAVGSKEENRIFIETVKGII